MSFVQVQHYNNIQKPHLKDYDVIVADFRFKNPPLTELLSKLKPKGVLLTANMEENLFENSQLAQQFDRIKVPLTPEVAQTLV